MFAQLSSFVALGLAVANAASISVTSAVKPAPTGWTTGYLEPYQEYNIRYNALDCKSQHNTTFFADCCHPLLANETLSLRPDVCSPSQAANGTASAVYATETSNNTEIYTEYCEEATSVASQVQSVIATATESISQVTLTSNTSTATVVVQFAPSSSASVSSSSEWTAPSSSAEAEATSSLWVQAAPVSTAEPSTSTYVAPSSTYVAPTSTYVAPVETTPASSGGDWKTGGHATYFYQNGNAGACGWYKSDSDAIIAINGVGASSYWTDYSKASPDCGRWVTIENTSNGKTVTAQVADVCPTCTGNGESIDLSVGAFQAIADMSQGQVDIKWKFN